MNVKVTTLFLDNWAGTTSKLQHLGLHSQEILLQNTRFVDMKDGYKGQTIKLGSTCVFLFKTVFAFWRQEIQMIS